MKKNFIIFIILFFVFELFSDSIDDSQNSSNKIGFRKDYLQYLNLKYEEKLPLVYYSDEKGYYYLTMNRPFNKPATRTSVVRVGFKNYSVANTTFSVSIDTKIQSGQVQAQESISKKILWTYLTPESPSAFPIATHSQVFVATEGGKLYCLNSSTGKLEWFFLTPGSLLIQPFVYKNDVVIIDDSGNMYWINRETGSLKYKYIMEAMPIPNIIIKDEILYIVNNRGYIHAVKLSDSRPLWHDLAWSGTVGKVFGSKQGLVINAGGRNSVFNYATGAKQSYDEKNISEDLIE